MSAAKQRAPSPPADADAAAREFAGRGGEYYAREFARIQAGGPPRSFNSAAALLGPLWAGARGLWGLFWTGLFLETFALVQLGRGLWGNLGAAQLERARRLAEKSQEMLAKAEAAAAAGNSGANNLARNADNLQRASDKAAEAAAAAGAGALSLAALGAVMLLFLRLAQGFFANFAYERKYVRWRADKNVGAGVRARDVAFAVFMAATVAPLTVYRFTASAPAEFLTMFPESRRARSAAAVWLDGGFDALAAAGADFFNGLTAGIRFLLDGMELALAGTPWPATFLVIVAVAWRVAGPRVAVFTAAALAYLGVLGFWEKSMATVALLGAAALLCVLIGVPLGVWCGKRERVYAAVRPALDFMQTMPAFVYLIPVIAFFGTGKPPGIIATIIFGLPPVTRLTALGIRQVPDDVKEAAVAFGCAPGKLLRDVELPLALPSIMAGVNQTILMCLSMVVIASLIGAKGLGEDVLVALQYAAKGQGLLAGFAILFCAMVIDRVVQGCFKSGGGRGAQ